MNLRQQFIWKILIALSFVIILIYAYNSFSIYSTYGKLKNDYQNDIDKVKNDIKEDEKTSPVLSYGKSKLGTPLSIFLAQVWSWKNHWSSSYNDSLLGFALLRYYFKRSSSQFATT